MPAIIELSTPNGDRRYATVVALGEDTATLDFGGRRYVLPFSEVDRYWEGPFIVLWRAASVTASSIAPGARGKDVEWVRQRLSELDGAPVGGRQRDVFDEDLRVPRHRVPARPIAGRGWDRRRGDPAPPERRRARSAHPAPVRDGLLTGRRDVLYPRRPQESRAEAAARAQKCRRSPRSIASPAAARPPIRLRLWPWWVAGAVIVVNAVVVTWLLLPAGRSPPHRWTGRAHSRRPAPRRRPRPAPRPPASARPCGRASRPTPPAPSAPAPPRAPATPGRPVAAPPTRRTRPRARVGIRSGDHPTRPRPSPGPGRAPPRRPRSNRDQPSVEIRTEPHTGHRACVPPRRRRHRRQARRGRRAPRPLPRRPERAAPLPGPAGRGRGPAARIQARPPERAPGITRPRTQARLQSATPQARRRICWRN